MRRGLAWGVTIPLAFAGSQAAHFLAYRLTYPEAPVRLQALFATGHAYLGWLPVALATAGACAFVTLAVTAADAAHGRPARELPAWAFALLPPAGFALQELLELSLHTGTFGWRAVLAPTFLPGLLLQVPFALAAFLAARLLIRAARQVGRALARPKRSPARPTVPAPEPVSAPFARLLVTSGGSRAPPRRAAFG